MSVLLAGRSSACLPACLSLIYDIEKRKKEEEEKKKKDKKKKTNEEEERRVGEEATK